MSIEKKPSSAFSKEEKKLVHFGLDWLRINICSKDDSESFFAKYFDEFFSSAEANDDKEINMELGLKKYQLNIFFKWEEKEGMIARFSHQGEYIFQFVKISEETTKLYNHRFFVQFNGSFFNQSRRGIIDSQDFLSFFAKHLPDTEYSITRIDICADIAYISPDEIKEKVKETLAIDNISFRKGDTLQTYYLHKKSSPWLARLYNKLAWARANKKEKYWLDYFYCGEVTRLEIQLNAKYLYNIDITLSQLQSDDVLLGLFFGRLHNKYNKWLIAKFVKKELNKKSIKPLPIPTNKQQKSTFDNEPFARTFCGWARNFKNRFDMHPSYYLADKMDFSTEDRYNLISSLISDLIYENDQELDEIYEHIEERLKTYIP